jgi:Xaa-Pro aminopeptidase
MTIIKQRIDFLRNSMDSADIDTLLVLVGENRFYLSGFSAQDHQYDESAGALLITQNQLVLATDSRFDLQAEKEAPLYEIVIYKKGLAKELPDLLKRLQTNRLGFEDARLSYHQYRQFKVELEKASVSVELVPLEDFVEKFRLIKSSHEIELTRQALELAEQVFRQVVKKLAPGITEKAVAWEMERAMRESGADDLSFPVIVAAGPNSALPHAIPTDRPIAAGEPILFDWGARLNAYCSDTSRTVILGPPDDTFKKVHQTVLAAQQRAIAAITSGASTKAVDAAARDYIYSNGFEGKFGHGTGHGTGLAVHEGPRLSPLKDTMLEAGMIVTVEPGIYLADWGGVRIENQVVVREDGGDVLNRLSTTYQINQI